MWCNVIYVMFSVYRRFFVSLKLLFNWGWSMHGIKRSTIQATTSVTRNTLREQGTLLRWCGKDRSRGKFGTKVAGSAMQLNWQPYFPQIHPVLFWIDFVVFACVCSIQVHWLKRWSWQKLTSYISCLGMILREIWTYFYSLLALLFRLCCQIRCIRQCFDVFWPGTTHVGMALSEDGRFCVANYYPEPSQFAWRIIHV